MDDGSSGVFEEGLDGALGDGPSLELVDGGSVSNAGMGGATGPSLELVGLSTPGD